MRPYSKTWHGKFTPESGRQWGLSGFQKSISAYEKLITRNANRSMKKGVRQQGKKQIQQELNP